MPVNHSLSLAPISRNNITHISNLNSEYLRAETKNSVDKIYVNTTHNGND